MATENSNNTFIQTPYEYLVNVPQFDIPASFYSLPFYNSASDEKTKIFSYMDTVLYNFLSYLITIYPFNEKPGNSNKTIEKVLNYVNNLMFIDNHEDTVPAIFDINNAYNTIINNNADEMNMFQIEQITNVAQSILSLNSIDILRHFFFTSMLYLKNNGKLSSSGRIDPISFYVLKSPQTFENGISFDLYRIEFYFNYFTLEYAIPDSDQNNQPSYLFKNNSVNFKWSKDTSIIRQITIKKYPEIKIESKTEQYSKNTSKDYYLVSFKNELRYNNKNYTMIRIQQGGKKLTDHDISSIQSHLLTIDCLNKTYRTYFSDQKNNKFNFLYYIRILFFIESVAFNESPIFNSARSVMKPSAASSSVRMFVETNQKPGETQIEELINYIKVINKVNHLYNYVIPDKPKTIVDITSNQWLFYEAIIQFPNNYSKSTNLSASNSSQVLIVYAFKYINFLSFSELMRTIYEYKTAIASIDAMQVNQKRSTKLFINVLFTTNDYWLTGVSDKVADTDKIVIDDSYNLLRKLENETQRKYYEYESLGKNATVTISHLDYNPSSKISYKGVDFQSIPLELDPSNYLINIYSETDKKSYRAIILPKNTLFNKNEKGYNIYELYEISQVVKSSNFNESSIHFYVPENSLFGNINFTYSINIDKDHERLMIVLLSNIDAGFVKALCEAYKSTDDNHKNELKNKFNLLLKILKRIK